MKRNVQCRREVHDVRRCGELQSGARECWGGKLRGVVADIRVRRGATGQQGIPAVCLLHAVQLSGLQAEVNKPEDGW